MRKLRNNFTSLLVLSLLALARIALGKTAPEYYHEGATNYVHGKWSQAKSAVTNGLSLFPRDEKLLALSKLLENQQSQQQQQQDQQQKEQEKQEKQEKQEQKDQKDQKDQESKQDQQQKEEKKDQQQEQQQQKPGDKQEQSQEKKPGEEGKDSKEQKDGGNAAQQLLQMTPEQAQRLLEAVKSDEKVMIFTPQVRTNRNSRTLKDW